jgi:hypothetical protein
MSQHSALSAAGVLPPSGKTDGRLLCYRIGVQDQIEEAAIYGFNLTRHYLEVMRAHGCDVEGTRFLELGPGRNLAHSLALVAAGLDVAVADRFLVEWDDAYHRAVYRRFLNHWPAAAPVVERALAERRHPLRMIPEPAEDLRSIDNEEMEVVFSHAVLEHVYDLPAVCRELYRITKPGGLHRHQIDFRDHRQFHRPLEFLLDDDARFAANLKARLWETGNRLRPIEVIETFQAAGFDLLSADHTDTTPPDYLANFLPRLRTSTGVYRNWPESDLTILGARIIFRKPRIS